MQNVFGVFLIGVLLRYMAWFLMCATYPGLLAADISRIKIMQRRKYIMKKISADEDFKNLLLQPIKNTKVSVNFVLPSFDPITGTEETLSDPKFATSLGNFTESNDLTDSALEPADDEMPDLDENALKGLLRRQAIESIKHALKEGNRTDAEFKKLQMELQTLETQALNLEDDEDDKDKDMGEEGNIVDLDLDTGDPIYEIPEPVYEVPRLKVRSLPAKWTFKDIADCYHIQPRKGESREDFFNRCVRETTVEYVPPPPVYKAPRVMPDDE